jgi:hypothetical protein
LEAEGANSARTTEDADKIPSDGGVCHHKLAQRNATTAQRVLEPRTQGQRRIAVRVQTHPGNTAGGVFGLRTTRPKEIVRSMPRGGAEIAENPVPGPSSSADSAPLRD